MRSLGPLNWFASNKAYSGVRHRQGIDNSRFLFLTTNEELDDEDDIVTISTLERSEAPCELNEEDT